MPNETNSSDPSGLRLRRLLVAVAAVVAFLVALGAASGFAGVIITQNLLKKHSFVFSPEPSGPSGSPASPQVVNGGPCTKDACNFLLLGSDSRNGLSQKDQKGFTPSNQLGGYNSDTILLVHVDPATQHATLVSFPRDLWVDIPGHGPNKINAAFSIGSAGHGGIAGGAALAAQTVSNLTGLNVNHAMVVDLAGFQNIVDALHGVPFCTSVPLVDDPPASVRKAGDAGSGLNMDHAGCYNLTGADALALVRARYVRGDCVGDFARIARQQQFLRSVMNKMLSPAEVTNLPTLIPAVVKSLTVDSRLKVTDLVDLANNLKGVASGNADFRTVPSKPGFEKVPEYSFPLSVLHIQPQGYELFKRLQHNQPLGDLGKQIAYTPPSPADIAVRVYDDNSQGKAQNDVYTANLSEAGFQMMATAAQPAAELAGLSNVILYNKGDEDQAKVVASYVPGVPVKEAKAGQLPADTQVGVVINHDYVHKNVGSGNNPTVQVNCPYSNG